MKAFLFRTLERLAETRVRLGVFKLSSLAVFFVLAAAIPAAAHASGLGDLLSYIGDQSLGRIFEGLAYIILSFADFLLYLIGYLFDFVLGYTVFGFGQYFSVSEGMLAAWSILRDIANIALIFGFVMIGIATMLDIHGYEVKKTLPRLIIFAVLLNFSLLASEVIIDTSNVFASVLYSASGADNNCSNTSTAECAKSTGSISGKIVQMSGISTVFSVDTNTADVGAEPGHTTWGMIYLGMAIFVTITAVVLLAGAIMLIIRAVVLSFLMVLSPVGFAGLAIPPLEKYAQMWWDKLLSQSFFAPVYLLLILVSIKIGQGITTAVGSNLSFANALADGGAGSIGILLIFTIMIGFMVASLIVAKQMGAMGADFAISTGRRVVNGAWAPARFMSSWAGRATANTAGSAAERAYNRVITKDNGFTKLMRFSGVDEGIAAGIAKVKNVKIEGKSYADRQKEIEHRSHEIHAIKDQQDLAENAKTLSDASKTAAEKENAQKTIDALTQKMSNKDIETAIKNGSAEVVAAISKSLNPEDFKKIMDNEKDGALSEAKKQEMREKRFKEIIAAIEKGTDLNAAKDLALEDLVQLSKLNQKFVEEQLIRADDGEGKSRLKETQLDAIDKSKSFNDTLSKLARDNTSARRVDEHIKNGRTAEAIHLLDHMSGAQKAQMKTETYAQNVGGTWVVNPTIASKITLNDMSKIMLDKKDMPSQAWDALSQKLNADHAGDAAWKEGMDRNNLLAQQMGWTGKSQQIDLLEQIVKKL